MLSDTLAKEIGETLDRFKEEGLYKEERILTSPQGSQITTGGKGPVRPGSSSSQRAESLTNFCSNNYLGLSSDPELIKIAKETLDLWGYGLSSSRFICGTQKIHKELERALSLFLGMEDTLLYIACFDANGGVFEPLLKEEDAIISDTLNHASLIDGMRLCKATKYRYQHNDMRDLERCLEKAASARYRLICTDGVFSMDGDIANLPSICRLAEQYEALVMVDDSHATGYLGEGGRGTAALCGVTGKVDLITTTFGKALGGAAGGCTSGRLPLIDLLRQRSRPYLFSNSLPPVIVGTTLTILHRMDHFQKRRKHVLENARYFRTSMQQRGFSVPQGETAIVPIMLHEAKLATQMAARLLEEGIYVVGFSFPVVPKGQARIRVQLSADHKREELERAVEIFAKLGRELGVLS